MSHLYKLEDIEKIFLQEYSEFNGSHLKVAKRFNTFGQNVSNTFLMTSDRTGFETFVIKGHGLKPEGLLNEWKALQLLQQNDFSSPKLLIPEHEPKQFLLLSYIEGTNAEDILKDKITNPHTLFQSMGKVTGKLHSISTDHIGVFTEQFSSDWQTFQQQKIEELFTKLQSILDKPFYIALKQFAFENQSLLSSDNLPPKLLSHDIYINNFLYNLQSHQTFLIDFGIALGGRPLFDLAKFFIIDLYNYPQYRNDFLKGYCELQTFPSNYKDLLKFYIFREAMGIVNYANAVHQEAFKQHGLTVLKEILSNSGPIVSLVE